MTDRSQESEPVDSHPGLNSALWDELGERYAHVTAALVPDRMPEPHWADLTRPAPDTPVEFALDVGADGRLGAISVVPPGASGILSVVPPANEPAPPITRDMIREAAERITAGAVFSPTSEFRPRRAGKMMEIIGSILERVEDTSAFRFVLAPAKWHAIMDRATEDERVILERAKDEGRIILSEFLPEPETAYRIQLPPEDYRRRVPWFLR
jgi:hypothetical protein